MFAPEPRLTEEAKADALAAATGIGIGTDVPIGDCEKNTAEAVQMGKRSAGETAAFAKQQDSSVFGLVEGLGLGLTLVHFSAQLERCSWDRGARRLCTPVLRGC
jgi:hypothetical protein